MELGEKIRSARLEAGLSQRQLCGDRITRNMLSLIENGAARPSMDTLVFMAKQLGKPVSWFLEEDAVASANQQVMQEARAAWRKKDAAGAVKALEGYAPPDPVFDEEKGILEHLALLELVQEALDDDRIPYAVSLLERAERCESCYRTEGLRLQLLRLRAGLEAELDCDSLLLEKAEAALETPERCASLLAAVEKQSHPRWQLLKGLCAYARQDYTCAAEHLERAEEAYPVRTVPLLEICYRELGDFKQAYAYACKRREKEILVYR